MVTSPNSGWNLLLNAVRNSPSDVRSTINSVTTGLNAASQLFGNSSVSSAVRTASAGLQILDSLAASGGAAVQQFGTVQRMSQNALQGIGFGGSNILRDSNPVQASFVSNSSTLDSSPDEWRVRILVPPVLDTSGPLAPLAETGNHFIFPFNPVILFGNSANYSTLSLTHTNYPFHAYENSQADNITITGEFFCENEKDAAYWIAAIHFLRTMTKMFYGNSEPQGNPPLVTRLKGYGEHVLNNIPIVITNYTVDMASEVDYISVDVDGKINHVPVQSQITVTCAVNYSRRAHSQFSLNTFAAGGHVGGEEGFI